MQAIYNAATGETTYAEFVPSPPPPPPSIVTMRQARLALLAAGLLDDVDAAIAAMEQPAKRAAEIEWEFATTVDRKSPFVGQLAQGLGLDSAALDQLFLTASGL